MKGYWGGNTNPNVTKSVVKATEEQKRDFVDKLSLHRACWIAYFLSSGENPFGTIYTCHDNSLYYLEEENAFDWSKTYEELMQMNLFKEIKKFQYKKEGDSKSYLLFDLEDGSGEKKISVDSLDPKEVWSKYQGFSSSL